MSNDSNYDVQNLMVLKGKISSFLDFRINNEWLKDCSIRQLIESGDYFIFTFNITDSEQRKEIKQNEERWM